MILHFVLNFFLTNLCWLFLRKTTHYLFTTSKGKLYMRYASVSHIGRVFFCVFYCVHVSLCLVMCLSVLMCYMCGDVLRVFCVSFVVCVILFLTVCFIMFITLCVIVCVCVCHCVCHFVYAIMCVSLCVCQCVLLCVSLHRSFVFPIFQV